MFSQAPRFSRISQGRISPQTYVIENNEEFADIYPPFNSSCGRQFDDVKSYGPGPKYYSKFRKYKIKGGSSLLFTTPRNCIVPEIKENQINYETSNGKSYGNIYTNVKQTMTFTRFPYCGKKYYKPSKPITNKLNGNIMNDGELKLDSPKQKMIMPFEQMKMSTFPSEFCRCTIKYKGTTFGKSKTKRELLKISINPGPGEYAEPYKDEFNNFNKSKVEMRENIYKQNIDTVSTKLKKCSIDYGPSPNDYFIDCHIVYGRKSHNKKGTFTKTKRFIYNDPKNPSPAAYSSLASIMKKSFSVKFSPFQLQQTRFRFKTEQMRPVNYNSSLNTIKNNCELKLSSKYAGKVTAFGSSEKRCTMKFPEDIPGPADYNIQEKCYHEIKYDFQPLSCRPSFNLSRFPKMKINNAELSPASYSIINSYNYINKKHNHRKPDNSAPFNIKSSRFPLLTDYIDADMATYSPQYESVTESIKTFRYCQPTIKKKIEWRNLDIPFYEVHPKYSSSLNKSHETFNRLSQSKHLKTEIENHENVILVHDNYCNKKSRKKLKCFII